MKTLKLIYIFYSLIYISCSDENNFHQNQITTNETPSAPVSVIVENAMIGNLDIDILTTGTTTSKQVVQGTLKRSGYIAGILELEGIFIKEGQIILTLNNEEEQIAISEARSELLKKLTAFGAEYTNPDSALTIIERSFANNYNEDINNDFIQKVLTGQKQEQVRMALSGLLDAWNSYRKAQLNYKQTIFKAPFSGYLANIEYKKGQWLPAGTAACTLIDISKIQVVCDVLESECEQIKPGTKAVVSFPTLTAEETNESGRPEVIGKVVEVNPMIDSEKHTMRVLVEIPNYRERFKPGMYAEVQITKRTLNNRLIVPKEALVIRDNRELVFIVRDSLAQWCYVKTGAKNNNYIEILSSDFGLKAGETVITSGHFSLAHNAKVSAEKIE